MLTLLSFKASRPRRVVMGFLKPFRSRSKLKGSRDNGQAPFDESNGLLDSPDEPGVDYISRLDATILMRIFGYVAPHTKDKSYDGCETSLSEQSDSECSLCDIRQLSYCALVQRSWYEPASRQLYVFMLPSSSQRAC
jgi:hypothetical protein